MTLLPSSKIREVHDINDQDKKLIKAYLQGAVYSWCKNRKNEWFAVRDLVGGENFEWEGTPLIVLFEKHKNKGKAHEASIADAGKDVGWLLKAMLDEDKRTFESDRSDRVAIYRYKIDG